MNDLIKIVTKTFKSFVPSFAPSFMPSFAPSLAPRCFIDFINNFIYLKTIKLKNINKLNTQWVNCDSSTINLFLDHNNNKYCSPDVIEVDKDNNIFILYTNLSTIFKVTIVKNFLYIYYHTYTIQAINSKFSFPSDICVYDKKLYVADTLNNQIKILSTDGVIIPQNLSYDGYDIKKIIKHPIKILVNNDERIIVMNDPRYSSTIVIIDKNKINVIINTIFTTAIDKTILYITINLNRLYFISNYNEGLIDVLDIDSNNTTYKDYSCIKISISGIAFYKNRRFLLSDTKNLDNKTIKRLNIVKTNLSSASGIKIIEKINKPYLYIFDNYQKIITIQPLNL